MRAGGETRVTTGSQVMRTRFLSAMSRPHQVRTRSLSAMSRPHQVRTRFLSAMSRPHHVRTRFTRDVSRSHQVRTRFTRDMSRPQQARRDSHETCRDLTKRARDSRATCRDRTKRGRDSHETWRARTSADSISKRPPQMRHDCRAPRRVLHTRTWAKPSGRTSRFDRNAPRKRGVTRAQLSGHEPADRALRSPSALRVAMPS